jgi:hypothetical protein
VHPLFGFSGTFSILAMGHAIIQPLVYCRLVKAQEMIAVMREREIREQQAESLSEVNQSSPFEV